MLKKVMNGGSDCFFKPRAKCSVCGKIMGDCIMIDEKGERNLGYHKYQTSSVRISQEEVNALPISLCTSKDCLEKAKETEAA